MAQTVSFRDLGIIEYGAAWALQEELLRENLAIKAERYNMPAADHSQGAGTTNHLLFCQHPHVYTLGKSGHMENLLVNDARLKDMDVSFYKTNRGGDITYHGPGQLVGYPVLDLELFFTDLGRYMRSLEEVIINTLAHFGIAAGRLAGATGVWLDSDIPGKARKICAMGVRCSRWVTIHGFALNINTDLSYFNYIVPCGISDKTVTSMEKELGYRLDEATVADVVKAEFAKVFNAIIFESENVAI
ncbi:MAG: lipoyl(octanoyl) transferase [Bacteroidetes bacterium 46-16]|nr:MAG: lipoyl(octanoyl) transferase [Bacteroidetes bacterium 46-16]